MQLRTVVASIGTGIGVVMAVLAGGGAAEAAVRIGAVTPLAARVAAYEPVELQVDSTLTVPPFSRDIAVRLRRLEAP